MQLETVVCDLEMLATVIQSHAERIARMAHHTDDEPQRLALWHKAKLLKDSSVEVRKQATALFSATHY